MVVSGSERYSMQSKNNCLESSLLSLSSQMGQYQNGLIDTVWYSTNLLIIQLTHKRPKQQTLIKQPAKFS